MSISVKQGILFIVTLLVGIAIGSYAAIYFVANFAEHGSIVSSVAQVKINYGILNELQSGNVEDAISSLELVTNANIDYLKACDSIACNRIEPESIQEAIMLFEKYESTNK